MTQKILGTSALLFLMLFSAYGQTSDFCRTRSSAFYTAGPTRSDTFDITHTTIELDFSDWSSQSLVGRADLEITTLQNGLDDLRLDLLNLSVDSVWVDSTSSTFSYTSPVIWVDFPSSWNSGEQHTVTIFYGGQPTTDASGWGGFYYGNNIAYNLGVGFDADPHNYGRTWFPCFDQFIERSTFTFKTITTGGRISQCTGVRTVETILGGDTLWTEWEMNQPIPSYLPGIAVGHYYRYTDSFTSMTGDVIGIEIAAQAGDTADVPGSFSHLIDALNCFETWYGPYQWDRVGYVLTGQGAMEHPTNVAYPAFTVDGSNAYDDLMAHELAHHWWGDYVTCSQAEHMWINEGMAEFSAHLFFECLNGRKSYLNRVRNNWQQVLNAAHLNDGGFLAVDGVGHSNTYGTHVYNKGAGVAHSMRGYLGDSLFNYGLQKILVDNALDSLSSASFQHQLTAATGVDMSDFFENWLYEPGFAEFGIDSVTLGANTEIWLSQGLRATTKTYENVPLEIGVYDASWNMEIVPVVVPNGSGQFSLSGLSSTPEFVVLDPNAKLMLGMTYEEEVFDTPVTRSVGRSGMTIEVIEENDSSYVRREHHWAGPRGPLATVHPAQISGSHYWSVRGSVSSSFKAMATMRYDGRVGQLDEDLANVTEDSLILVYRAPNTQTWREYPYYTKDVMGNSSNRLGRILIDSLLLGDYAFANGTTTIGLNDGRGQAPLRLYPNPAEDLLRLDGLDQESAYVIYDELGRSVRNGRIREDESLSIAGLSSGHYHMHVGEAFLPFSVVR